MKNPILALVIGAVLIGFAPVFAKLAVNSDVSLNPTSVAFLRLSFALPFLYAFGGRVRSIWDGIPGILFAIDLGLWHWAFEHTSIANATLEANLAVIIASIAGIFIFKERLAKGFYFGVVLALIGIMGLLGVSAQVGNLLGDFLGVSTAFAYASYMIAIKIRRPHTDLLSLLFTTALFGAICLGVTTYLQGGGLYPQNITSFGYCIGLTLTSQVLGQGFIAYGIGKVPIGLAAAIILVQPIIAAILSYFWLDQSLSLVQIGFGGIAILGIYLAQKFKAI